MLPRTLTFSGHMRAGFTLLELSIVLVIIALIVGGGLVTMNGYLQASQFNVTVARMEAIDKALLDYSVVNGRIPCPGDLALTASSANYGVEAATPGTCSGGTPAATLKAASGTVEGGVPTRTLRMPDDYLYDGWGRRIRYAVDPTYTSSSPALPVTASCTLAPTANATAIRVNDATGAARTTTAAYALISHGANGHGAYTSNGVKVNASSANTDEQANCHCDSSGALATYTPTYVQKTLTRNSASVLDAYDDIVTFKDAWQMQAQNAQAAAATCGFIYVVDSQNTRIQKFSTSGAYIGQFPVPGGGNANEGLVIDSSGNLYTQQWSANVAYKYSNTGILLLSLGSGYNGVSGTPYQSGTGSGQLSGPWGVAVDASGNIWVTEIYNDRVQQYNSSGVPQNAIGAGYHGVSGATCSVGNGNGQFDTPMAVALDGSGNVWVVDNGNSRIQKFDSSSIFQAVVSSYGQNNGNVITPTGMAFDGSGNVWVVDNGNNRVEEFSSSGVWMASLGGTASACASCLCTGPSTCPNTYGASYSGNGQFNGPNSVAIDSSGNIWVSDTLNNRVQEFSSSGTYLMSIGAGYNGVSGSVASSGTGNGQFNRPEGIFISTK